ncbi:MAG: hypothetical protein KDE26_27905, partial [Bacteroidetes bacterium]|nr:hypothetical protein [Bacteroidota bacterium]
RPVYFPILDQPFSEVGSPWFWVDMRLSRDFFLGRKGALSLSVEVKNITNYQSAAIINGVTGRAYELGDPVPEGNRDPVYPDPQDRGLPMDNPARYLAPRQIFFGAEFRF